MPIVNVAEFVSTKFDYLIVGGGTAGLCLAARLSEDPASVVGVIEAGGHDINIPQILVPGMIGSTISDPIYDWNFFSVPQTHANDRVILMPRGKGLGGSSLINFMTMTRPSKEEFDALETLGNKGWNWDSMLKYMKKSENTLPTNLGAKEAHKYAAKPQTDLHGHDGPIYKSLPSNLTELHALLFDTVDALGVPRNEDSNGGRNVGAVTSFSSVDSRTDVRSSATTAYFEPNAGRSNLLILTNAQVLKLLLESEANGDQRATGVEFMAEGVKRSIVGVRKDIVLSAGTFQTPQLLELSGIGNKDILRKHGIACVIDLPAVGENLQDHIRVSTMVEVDSKFETIDVVFDGQMAQQQELYQKQQGFLASVPTAAYLYFSAYSLGKEEQVQAWQTKADTNIEADIANTIPSLRNGLRKQYKHQRTWFMSRDQAQAEIINYNGHQAIPGLQAVPGKRYTTLSACLMHPLSRGTVHISSANPLDPPAINTNFFANESDLDLLVRVLQFTLKIYATSPLGDFVKAQILPPAAVVEGEGKDDQDERLRQWVKERCGTVYHPVGTAGMLLREDGGVVDSELKVYGTSNLRVVDLSILPMEMSFHTQSAAYAIAEKAADILKGTAL